MRCLVLLSSDLERCLLSLREFTLTRQRKARKRFDRLHLLYAVYVLQLSEQLVIAAVHFSVVPAGFLLEAFASHLVEMFSHAFKHRCVARRRRLGEA